MDGSKGPRYQKLVREMLFNQLKLYNFFLWNFLLLLYWQLQYLRIHFYQDALHKIIIYTHSQINSSIFDSFISKLFIQKNTHTSQCYLCSFDLGPTLMYLSQSLGKSEFAWRFSHVYWIKLN